jgi:hypothetical protein
VALLLQAADKWRQEYGSTTPTPSTSKDRSAFKEMLSSMRRQAEDVPFDVSHALAVVTWIPVN